MSTPSERNEKYEQQMKATAIMNHVVDQQRAVERERAGTVHPWNGLVSKALGEAEAVLKRRLAKRGGKSATGVQTLRDCPLPLRKVCAIGARTITDGIAVQDRVQKIVGRVGTRIEDEVRMIEFRKREPALYKRMIRDLKERGSEDYAHRRGVLVAALKRANSEEQWQPWTLKERAHLGLLVADALREAGIIERAYVPGRAKNQRHEIFVLTDAYEEGLRLADEAALALINPWFKPMLVEPADWDDPFNGGYSIFELDLIKSRSRYDLERLRERDLSTVYDAVNAVQRTPWRVNEDVLVVAQELKRLGVRVEGLPERVEDDEPVRPADIPPPGEDLTEDEQNRLKLFLSAKREYHNGRAKRKSKNALAFRTLEIARELKDEPAIFFPQQLDYRGRMYSVPLMLNPQGNDLSKGLLTFGTERPLGDMGGYWLAVHGANCWGKDKGPLNERVDWVEQNETFIRNVAEDPFTWLAWTEADSPWQFLAFCFEWARVDGFDHASETLSSLPVSVDGSCNGLQHFSALLRDEVGASLTNLRKSEEQHDIYQEVAVATEERVREHMTKSATDRELGGLWLERGIDRKVVKRPVMTTPYGATAIGMKDMVLQDTIEPGDFDFGAERWKAASWLAERIDEALADKVSGAREAMSFLQELASALAADETPIAWVTPVGFPVVQDVKRRSTFAIDTQLLGRIQLRFAEQTPHMDRRRQRAAVAPNFVHSYDAAHLMLTVIAAEAEAGRPLSWAMVHDSFGTHAGDVDLMGQVLREQFVLMYSDRDPLAELREQVAAQLPGGVDSLPPAPAKGGFDLNEVLEAEFFFA